MSVRSTVLHKFVLCGYLYELIMVGMCSMNARATSARVAAECLLLALHPPLSPVVPAATPTPAAGEANREQRIEENDEGDDAVGEIDAAVCAAGQGGARQGGERAAGQRAASDPARGRAEEKWFRKAEDIVLGMLKTRLY